MPNTQQCELQIYNLMNADLMKPQNEIWRPDVLFRPCPVGVAVRKLPVLLSGDSNEMHLFVVLSSSARWVYLQ